MFYYLNGIVSGIEPNVAVIDCQGVGYACFTSMRSLSMLKTGEKAKMYTYCYIREDAFDIYGFTTQRELYSFKMLLGISGVGPKAALSILSASSPEELALAVIEGNEKALTLAQGIGKKLAQRIILELKDKVSKEMDGFGGAFTVAPSSVSPQGTKASDVAAALAVLGYSAGEIGAALKKTSIENLTVEEAIREVLKTSLK
jgi:Holliday junction DNA helicase RuvA